MLSQTKKDPTAAERQRKYCARHTAEAPVLRDEVLIAAYRGVSESCGRARRRPRGGRSLLPLCFCKSGTSGCFRNLW
jgi:hypothetical protein